MSKPLLKAQKRSSAVFEEAPAAPRPSKKASPADDNKKGQSWYDKPITTMTTTDTLTPQLVKRVREDAEKRYRQHAARYQDSLQMTRSDKEWFVEVTKKGTMKDKLAAYAMAIQEGPFHAVDHLQAVLALAASENRHENLGAAEAMTDILVGNDFLPKTRKLFYLHQRPLTEGAMDDDCLVHWYFEDQLKTIFFSFLKIVERMLQDTVEYNRERATRFLFDLIMACPLEQQTNTLSLLANKLGDPHKKLSSRIIFYMEELVKAHPKEATLPVITAVKEVITRPAVPERAQYYGLTLFSQLYFSQKQPEIVAAVMSVYTVFFKSVVVPIIVDLNKKKKDKRGKRIEEDAFEPPRLAKAVLAGINRALPFLPPATADTKRTVNDFFEPLLKLCKMSNVNTAILSLSLFHQLSKLSENALQRNILFNQLGDLVGEWLRLGKFSNSFNALFALLDKIVDEDQKVDGKLERLAKRLINSAVHMDANFAQRALLWLAKTIRKQPRLRASITMPPEGVEDVRETALFELVALSKHHDPVVSSMAVSVLNGTPMTVGEHYNVEAECAHRRFMLDVTELAEGAAAGNKALVDAFKAASSDAVKKPKTNKKTSKKDDSDLSDADIDGDSADESSADSGFDDDLLEDEDDLISDGDMEFDDDDDDQDEEEYENEDAIFESAEEESD